MKTLNQQETLQHLTFEFQSEFIKKILDLDAISNSIRAFNLIHLKSKAIGLECDELHETLFDEFGNWNKIAKVDENNSIDEFEQFYDRIKDILYPNILSEEEDDLSFKEKVILSALVYDIQSNLFNIALSNLNCENTETLYELQHVRNLLYEAANNAIRHALPYLKTYLMTAEFNKKVAYPKQAFQLHSNKPHPKSSVFSFGFFDSFIETICCSEKKEKNVLKNCNSPRRHPERSEGSPSIGTIFNKAPDTNHPI